MKHGKHSARHAKRGIFLVVAFLLLFSGGAFAYFILSSTGTSYVTDAPAPSFTVVVSNPVGGLLSPGVGSDMVAFTVTNSSSAARTLNVESYALTTDAQGGVFDTASNKFVDTCQANWFNIGGGDGGVVLPFVMAPGDSLTNGQVTVTIPSDPTDDQSACEGLSPQVTVSVS